MSAMKAGPGARAGIVCLAHLGWDNVWQRPQHILSRVAHHYPVLYVNEPELMAGPATAPALRMVADEDNVHAWQPYFPGDPATLGRWRELYVEQVQDLLVAEGWAHHSSNGWQPARPLILWFYTPTPYYFLERMAPALVVYDVMDELSHVSTPVPDVVANWSDVVRVAGDARQVVRAVEAILAESPAERRQRYRREEQHVARSTWDAIVGDMLGHVDAAWQERRRRAARPVPVGQRAETRSRPYESTAMPTIE